MAKCYDQFLEHVRQLYSINYGYLVRAMVRVRLGIGLGLGLRSGQSQCVLLFRSVNYHILVKSGTRRAVVPFRSAVPFCSGNYNNPSATPRIQNILRIWVLKQTSPPSAHLLRAGPARRRPAVTYGRRQVAGRTTFVSPAFRLVNFPVGCAPTWSTAPAS